MIRFQTNNWTDRDSLRNHMQEEHILHAFMRNDALCLSYTDTKKANQHTLAGNGVNLRKLMVDIFFYFLLTTIIHVSMIKKCI